MYEPRTIFFVDDCEATRKVFEHQLSKIPLARVMTFATRDAMWPAMEFSNPCLVILDEELGSNVKGATIAMEIAVKYPGTDTMIVSTDAETVKTLLTNGVYAMTKPTVDDACSYSSKCWANYLLRVETRMAEFANREEIRSVYRTIDEINEKLDRVCTHMEKMEKADILDRVNNFMEEAKKKPLLMLIVSLLLAGLTIAGFKLK